MLNQVLLAARLWIGKSPLVAIKASLGSASQLLSRLKGWHKTMPAR